jgi:hypothetical protein
MWLSRDFPTKTVLESFLGSKINAKKYEQIQAQVLKLTLGLRNQCEKLVRSFESPDPRRAESARRMGDEWRRKKAELQKNPPAFSSKEESDVPGTTASDS